jgi:acetylornithine/N-succinyldiaminopimelate aminotransferase
MNFDSIKQRDQQYVMHTYGRFDLAVEKGQNALCWDFDGKEYVDFTSGIGVNSLGFCDEGWIAAITAQLHKLQHISNLYYTGPCIDVAQQLCERTGFKRVFFGNSGAETNEGAIKAARKYSFVKYGDKRNLIVSLNNSFHGRTVTTLAATGQQVFHNYFFPFTEGFLFAEPNDLDDTLSKLNVPGVCAVLIELVQGEGGVMPLDKSYVDAVVAHCKEKDILVIVDEVQTGIGRTGTLFCFEQFGFLPDIVTSAKGLAGGLPFGAILFSEKAMDAFVPGDHATTFGGNPIAAAGALYVLNSLTDGFLKEVTEKGAYFKKKLLAMPHVKDVSGIGLMIGIELEGVAAADVVKAGIPKGVITLTAKTKLRLLPPLSITYAQIDQGLTALEAALASM